MEFIEMGHSFWFYDEDTLLDRLEAGVEEQRQRPVVFLLGSPLTAPVSPGQPGVPGVAAMIERMEAALGREGVPPTDVPGSYQEAFNALLGRRGQDAVNEVVRRAVLEATLDAPLEILDAAAGGDEAACGELERWTSNWPLNEGLLSLGQLIARFPKRFRTVLTSNFDPLIEIGVRKAGHEAWRTVLHGDGTLSQSNAKGCHVVYIHGYWYGADTLHGPGQLQAPRPKLRSSLRRLLEECTLVVLAYGGWDDVFTQTLVEVVNDQSAYPDVLWTFHSGDQSRIEKDSARLLESLVPGVSRGRVALYRGIDCHSVLLKLQRWLMPSATRVSNSVIAPIEKENSTTGHPPFVVGAPIRRDEDFLGRNSQIGLIRDTVEKPQPAQILGERRMGKTSFLLWLKRNVSAWQAYPVAFVWAQGPAGRSPAAFVRGIAEALGRAEEIKEQLKHGDAEAAGQALDKLLPVLILVDEAANLAKPEHGFHNDFLDTLRAFGQRGDLIWISASHLDLRKLFLGSGRTSNFLNDARQVSIGQLEDEAARELVSRLKDEGAAEMALDLAGGFAFGLQWLADEFRRNKSDHKTIETSYSLAMDLDFQLWWKHCDSAEQLLLRQSIAGLEREDLDKHARRRAHLLQELGLLAEHAGSLYLPGRAWRSFVEGISCSTKD